MTIICKMATLERGCLTAFPISVQVRRSPLKPLISRETVVLIVEDEPIIRLSATELVQELGYRTYEAGSADEAILLLEAHAEITIILTDIQMAGTMDGLGLARLAAERWPPLRFIIVSGVLSPCVDEMPVGAIFLSKPYAESAIASSIASHS